MPAFESKAISSQGVLIKVQGGVPPASKAITGITKANPAEVTAVGHGYPAGKVVMFSGVGGMVEINGQAAVVGAPMTVDTFAASGIDSTNYGVWTAGGSVDEVPFADLCEVKTFTGFDGTASEIDATTICSEAKEVRMGLQDFGQFSFGMNYVPDDPGQMALQTAKAAGTPLWFRFVLPGTYGEWVFQAYVKSFPIAGGVDTILNSNVVLRISGAPTFYPGA